MTNPKTTVIEEMKELLSDPKNRIRLDDYVTMHIKAFLTATDLEHFPVQGVNVQKEDFLERIQKYEGAMSEIDGNARQNDRWDRKMYLLRNDLLWGEKHVGFNLGGDSTVYLDELKL